MIVVTISGKAQHGKDSTAECLKDHLEWEGQRVLIIHYADYLKFVCQKYFGWDGAKDDKGRTILQHVGTDLVRARKPTFWVDTVLNLMSVIGDSYDFVIIPDTRFPNEILAMKQLYDTVSVHVTRSNFDNGLSEEQKAHPSETALDGFGFDYMIVNESGVDNVESSALELMLNYGWLSK